MTIEAVIRHGMDYAVLSMTADGKLKLLEESGEVARTYSEATIVNEGDEEYKGIIKDVCGILGCKLKRGTIEWQRLELVITAITTKDLNEK